MIWAVVGGQYGSEGKGAFCAHIARQEHFKAAVRGGGPQAGHTFFDERFGGKCVVRQVPVASVVDPECIGYIGPGAVVDPTVLAFEMHHFDLRNVWVHPNAIILESRHKSREVTLEGAGDIPGSTLEGVGAVRAERALRLAKLARTGLEALVDLDLSFYNRILDWAGGPNWVMAEGTQGFNLSLFHGVYPFVTSADTTPPALLSEVGLPCSDLGRVTVVLRTFPIRVGGASGPFQSREIGWLNINREPEVTTVTGRVRRIAEFEWSELGRMVRIVKPNDCALMFCDYLDPAVAYTRTLPPAVKKFVDLVAAQVWVNWVGVGTERYLVRDLHQPGGTLT